MTEKRRFQRIPFRKQLAFKCVKGTHFGELKDLSLGGAYIENPTNYPYLRETVEIAFYLDNETNVVVFIKGEVVRIEEGKGFAVKFVEIDPKSFTHLKNIIYYNSPNPEAAKKEIYEFLGEAYPMFQTVKYLAVQSLKNELIKYLLSRAFLYSPDKPFILSSGKESPYYLDCRKVTLYSSSFQLIGDLFWEEVRFSFVDGVAGMSIGADPIVCAVLASAIKEGVKLEGLLVRKEPKKYGTQKQIEGNIKPGMRVALVEDVVTTGGSVLKALSALREAGAQVVKVLALVDREEGGRSAIEGEGVPFHAFFTIEEILSAYKAQKSILFLKN